MFIDEDRCSPPDRSDVPATIPARNLLTACAAEAGRQAAAAARLDVALGAALGVIRTSTAQARDWPDALAPLAAELQQVDLLRQELQGLGRTLALLAEVRSLATSVSADRVRTCAPLGELQRRLLSGSGQAPSV